MTAEQRSMIAQRWHAQALRQLSDHFTPAQPRIFAARTRNGSGNYERSGSDAVGGTGRINCHEPRAHKPTRRTGA